MGLSFWFPDDVARILTTAAVQADGVRGPEYFLALEHVALAFGVEVDVRSQQDITEAPIVEAQWKTGKT